MLRHAHEQNEINQGGETQGGNSYDSESAPRYQRTEKDHLLFPPKTLQPQQITNEKPLKLKRVEGVKGFERV